MDDDEVVEDEVVEGQAAGEDGDAGTVGEQAAARGWGRALA